MDFGSPPPTVGADGAAKFNESEMEQTWKGSLIKLKSGKFLQFAGVEFDSAKPMESTVLFRPGATGASAARFSVKVLLDPSARANVCNSIILGFLGGTFKADGLTVRVTKVRSQRGSIESVIYAPLDGSGKALGSSEPTPISEFIEEFKPTGVAEVLTGQVGSAFETRSSELLEFQRPSQMLEFPRPSEALETREPSELLELQRPSQMLEFPRPSEALETREPSR